MRVSWSVTEGLLSSTVGTDVTLTATATKSTAYISTVQVLVSDGRGGTAQGSVNVQFGADGLPVLPVEATASQPTPEPCIPPTPEPTAVPSTNGSGPTTAPTAIPIQQDGRTFYLDLIGDMIQVQPGALKIAPGTNTVRFQSLRGDWEVVSQDDVVGPGIGRDLFEGNTTEFPVWALFDPDLSYIHQMRFSIYHLATTGTGYKLRSGSPLSVTVTK
jgi:hypothetical protein